MARPKKSRKRRAIFALVLVAASVFLGFFVLEVLLRTGVIKSHVLGDPRYSPKKYLDMDRAFDRAHEAMAAKNSLGMNDRDRTQELPPGIIRRIAVLGDSYIWGDGIPYDVIWSHRLEAKIAETHPNVEVVSWGRCGWSTLDELNFLKETGWKFRPDLLIVGWVTNDPNVDNLPVKEIRWRRYLFFLEKTFPDLLHAVAARANKFLYRSVLTDYGYENWQNNLYKEGNLKKYQAVLDEFAAFCREKQIPVLFVMTPHNHWEGNKAFEDRIKPLLDKAGLPWLDLYPAVKEQLGRYTCEQLQANPADAHPGTLMTALFSKEVFAYLETRYPDLLADPSADPKSPPPADPR